MFLFQPPPPPQYDLRFSIAGIPVRVHPLFWLIALLFGPSGDLVQLTIWVIVVCVSVLFHGLGDAVAMRYYGQPSRIIRLVGGLTVPEPVAWGSRWANVPLHPNQEIFISLAGAGAGFLLAALVAVGATIS